MDEVVGNITAVLKAKRMYEQTIIVYSSDNGAIGKASILTSDPP